MRRRGSRPRSPTGRSGSSESPDSPVARYTPEGADRDAVFDIKVVYPRRHGDIDLGRVPRLFLPEVGPLGLTDYEKVYAVLPDEDIFDLRGIDPAVGCVVVVRPDHYVANVLPLTATDELAAFFAQVFLPIGAQVAAR